MRPDRDMGGGFGAPMPVGVGMLGPPDRGRTGGMGLHVGAQADPEMYELVVADEKLERESHGLAQHYRRIPKEERTELRREVTRLAEKHFDVRQQRRMLELKRLQEELQRLRRALELRAEARQKLIDRRVSELVGPDDPEVTF